MAGIRATSVRGSEIPGRDASAATAATSQAVRCRQRAAYRLAVGWVVRATRRSMVSSRWRQRPSLLPHLSDHLTRRRHELANLFRVVECRSSRSCLIGGYWLSSAKVDDHTAMIEGSSAAIRSTPTVAKTSLSLRPGYMPRKTAHMPAMSALVAGFDSSCNLAKVCVACTGTVKLSLALAEVMRGVLVVSLPWLALTPKAHLQLG